VPSRIRILSEDLANRIAAGEVVEGPHSVVKELVENAIDAGADAVTINVKGAGSDLVRVSDNGVGMNRDDALASFDRFATSKITGRDDLEAIDTLGFRGEALPSIASVSRVRLTTCEPGTEEGTEVTLVGGEVRDVRPTGRAGGTTVEVSSLFFNTPARRKFLRSDRVELRRILELVGEYAVLYPAMRIDVTVEGRTAMSLPPAASVAERASAIIGSGRAGNTMEFESEDGPYTVRGLIGSPSSARTRGALQILAVNGRPVRSRLVTAAVRNGYGELLPRSRHPVFAILIDADTRLVDANVHPTKREVRFSEDRRIFALVERAVRETLLAHDIAPSLAGPASEAWRNTTRDPDTDGGAQLELPDARATDARATQQVGVWGTAASPSATAGETDTLRETGESLNASETGETAREAAKFWQLHGLYIFIQTREGVLVVDQHAAHERILYEEARERLSGVADAGPSQQLLFPIAVELSPAEWETFGHIDTLLERLGFSVRPMSGRTVMLEAVPGAFQKWPQERILQEVLAEIPTSSSAMRDLIESMATTFACKTAIKAGQRLNEDEMRGLVDRLFATELPFSCPHGRPTFMRMTLSEFDRKFGRT